MSAKRVKATSVAVLNDIHGNLPALEAVLREVRAADVEAIVCGGDVIVGPRSREALDLLAASPIAAYYLYGNAEVAVIEQLAGRTPAGVPEVHRPVIAWTAEQVGASYGATLAKWPATVRLSIDAIGDVVFCHGTPRDENEIFTRLTPEARLLPLIEPLDAAAVVCGHTHMQFDRRVGRTRVVNAGSVGMPWGSPGADWLLLGPDVQLRRTEYDVSAAAASVAATGYPDPGDFFVRSVTAPPAAAQMEEVYERLSLRSTRLVRDE